MSDRHNALVVVLDANMRSDDLEPLAAAIRQLRGVTEVIPNVSNINDAVSETRVAVDLGNTLIAWVRQKCRQGGLTG